MIVVWRKKISTLHVEPYPWADKVMSGGKTYLWDTYKGMVYSSDDQALMFSLWPEALALMDKAFELQKEIGL